ncbi:potassium channel family protein [Sinomonas terrae]|uniref:Potassium channel family protein n=1 Tax=Sinomonas terrae TaxID=2908838 RepID=A0ABS9U6B6_9MICC|nr:potassium channel family protein [Sinomonas terrae]MCH6472229.1 potassium channel family protein [Sinomonas terrae]
MKRQRNPMLFDFLVLGVNLLVQVSGWVIFVIILPVGTGSLMDQPLFWSSIPIIGVWFLASIGASTTSQSPWPTIANLVYALSTVVWFFSMMYWIIGTPVNFGGSQLSKVDAIYFALGMLSTAGTGSLSPTSDTSRLLVSMQMLVDIAFTGFVLVLAVTRLGEHLGGARALSTSLSKILAPQNNRPAKQKATDGLASKARDEVPGDRQAPTGDPPPRVNAYPMPPAALVLSPAPTGREDPSLNAENNGGK